RPTTTSPRPTRICRTSSEVVSSVRPARLAVRAFARGAPVHALACAALLVAGVTGVHAQWAGDKMIHPVVLAEVAHDTSAFTQGLLWLDGKLYESTGLYGASSLREVHPASGAVTRRAPVPDRYFAEGLAWYRGAFWQLTWKEEALLRWPRD